MEQVVKQEQPLFEGDYVKNGGDLQFIVWVDEVGAYKPNQEKISLIDHGTDCDKHEFEVKIMKHAEHVQSCLMSWVGCAKLKAIPEGYYLMPLQPCEEMLKKAELEFQDLNIDIHDIQDRIVFAHQAMIQVRCQSSK